jgi:hypothetical protein
MKNIDIPKYIRWIEEKKSFDELRADLVHNGIPPEEVKHVLEYIDEFYSKSQLSQILNRQGLQLIVAGSILSVLSLFVFFNGFLPMVVVGAGGFTTGVGMIFAGKSKLTIVNRTLDKKSLKIEKHPLHKNGRGR